MTHQKGYGASSIDTKVPVTARTNFQIASNTKAFTTAALSILVDEGKVKWDDKVKEYIREFKMYTDSVTDNFNIVNLLTHRSGLGLGAGDLTFYPDGADFTVKDVVHIFRHFKPVSAFRTKYSYDNLLYIIAGEINLPDSSGVDLCKQVKQQYPLINIVGLSTFNQQYVIRNMIDNGASGYVLKNATKQELLTAITTVSMGKTFLSFEAVQSLRETTVEVPVISRREKEVLQLVAEGFTNAEIAAKLFISVPTVNTHRRSLNEKFDAANTAVLISKAIKGGLV